MKQLKNEENNQKNFPQIKQLKEKQVNRKKILTKLEKKAIKDLDDFNSFTRDEVVEPGQKCSFSLAGGNVKQEMINSY